VPYGRNSPRNLYTRAFSDFSKCRDGDHRLSGLAYASLYPDPTRTQIDGADFWMRSSRRHWEKDTLVVDSISLIDETWFDRGTSHRAIHQVAGERRSAFLASPLEAALR